MSDILREGTEFRVPGIKGTLMTPSPYYKDQLDQIFVVIDEVGYDNEARVYMFTDRFKQIRISDLPGKYIKLKDNGVWINIDRDRIEFQSVSGDRTRDVGFYEANAKIFTLKELLEMNKQEIQIKTVTVYEYNGVAYNTKTEAQNEKVFSTIHSTGIFGKAQMDFLRRNIELLNTLTLITKE